MCASLYWRNENEDFSSMCFPEDTALQLDKEEELTPVWRKGSRGKRLPSVGAVDASVSRSVLLHHRAAGWAVDREKQTGAKSQRPLLL